jgi:outer membrane translocation and assembly module TamA
MFYIGPRFQFFSYDSTDNLNKTRNVGLNTLSIGLNPATLHKKQGYFGATAMLSIDTRNSRALTTKGINWVTTFSSLSGTNKNSYDRVTQLSSDFAFYLQLIPNERLVFANRTGVGVTGGNTFEFFQAQYLGTNENLRGFRRERFAGRSKFYNQAELRLKVANLKTYLFPAAFGLFAFVDNGRVWVKNDTVNKMATGYGGGVWFAPLRRIVISVAYAMSVEDKLPVVRLGWQF